MDFLFLFKIVLVRSVNLKLLIIQNVSYKKIIFFLGLTIIRSCREQIYILKLQINCSTFMNCVISKKMEEYS